MAGALVLATQPLVEAQSPTVRNGRDGRPVMQFSAVPESTMMEPSRFPLQAAQEVPLLTEIGPNTPSGTPYPPAEPTQFNIQPHPGQQVQFVTERRGFLQRLFPWTRRDSSSSEYEQPVEPPNQYQSNPLPPNSETEFGPAMSGFNHRYQRPATTQPPRTAQGPAATNTPPGFRPTPTPTTPPQSTGTTTTNDGRELPVFQFGTNPRGSGGTLTPPPAPRPQPSATPTPTPSETGSGPTITPITPMPPVLPLNAPGTTATPISESSSTEEIEEPQSQKPQFEEPQFEDPFVQTPAGDATRDDDAPMSDGDVSAFPPPPSSTAITQPPALTVPSPEEASAPALVPPGAPRIELPEEAADMGDIADPQLSADPPALPTPETQTNVPPAFVSGEEVPESNEDKLARIRERRGQTGLKGFCPVMLRDHRELVDARPEFSVEFNGHTYHVSSAEALATFQSDPAKYAPALGGSDIVHSDLTGEKLPGSLDHAVWYRGRLYMFATAETLETFVAAPSAHRTDL